MAVIIPKALPVRLWLNGTETFNEERPFNQQFKLFAQKFNLSDHIVLQIQDSEDKAYSIVIKDEDGNELEEIAAIKELVEGIYFYSWDFTFDDFDLEEGCYSLELYTTQIDGDGNITALLGQVAGDGETTSPFVQIEGDGDVDGLLGAVEADGENYPYSSDSFRLSADLADICTAPVMVLYYEGVFTPGVTVLYIDKEFSTWPVGYNYVVIDGGGNEARLYNDINGMVGSGTGTFC